MENNPEEKVATSDSVKGALDSFENETIGIFAESKTVNPEEASESDSSKQAAPKHAKLIALTITIAIALFAATAAFAGSAPSLPEGVLGNESSEVSTKQESASEAESPVQLIQLERSVDGISLEPLSLSDDSLVPMAGSIGGPNGESGLDGWGMPASDAFVDMVVGVSNCSNEGGGNTAGDPLYVRVLVAAPAALEVLDDPATSEDESLTSPLHLVDGSSFSRSNALKAGQTLDAADQTAGSSSWLELWSHTVNSNEPVEIDGVNYNVHVLTYKKPLASGEITQLPAIVGFYLDSAVDYDHATQTLTYNGTTTNLALLGGGIGIPVSAQASSDSGFVTATKNPWEDDANLLGKLSGFLQDLGGV